MTNKITTFVYRVSDNTGSLNLLEPSGLTLACTTIALPLTSDLLGYNNKARSFKIHL